MAFIAVNTMGKTVRAARKSEAQTWGLRAQSGARKYLSAQERKRFLQTAENQPLHEKAFCLTLALTGCRISEALALTSEDLDDDQKLIVFRCLKKRGRIVFRQVPIPAPLVGLLRQCLKNPMESPRTRFFPWGRSKGWKIVKRVMAQSEASGVAASPKGLRHSFGVHAILNGVPLPLLQKWLGHECLETTAIYLQVIGPEERAFAQKMWRL